jgi:sugar lactone lactonase YvrE
MDPNTDTLYVSDGNNQRVMSYTLNSTVGTLVAGGNGVGVQPTQLYYPRGLHFDSLTNSLLIVNNLAHNVVRWVIGASNWTLVAGNYNGSTNNPNNSRGSDSTQFNGPWDVALDPYGNTYVSDRYNQRIQFFRPGELNGTTIAGVTGVSDSTPNLLNGPLSIALDSKLNLYVSDSVNNRIQKFTCY